MVGGAAALITVLFIPIQMIVFVVSPPPATVLDYFTLFQSNRLLGLLDLDLLHQRAFPPMAMSGQ